MAYIGTDINYGNLAFQTGTGDGSDTTPIATLSYTVPTSASIMVTLDGVTQVPDTDYTASGTTLTFTTAPVNLVKILVYFLGRSLDIGTPADNTVDSAQLVAGSVDDAHLATGITASKLSGVVPTANLGTGTASSSTILYGDGTYKTEPVSAPYMAWQAVVTASTLTAVAGRGYPINTTSNACTVTLPASASVGDTIKIIDYLRTWETNAITINPNSLKFQGYTTPQPVYNTNGQSVTFTYVDVTQGWLPTVDDDVTNETPQSLQASGGTEGTYTYDSIDYKWHKFTATGTTNLVISAVNSRTIDILVIAGAGGGGGARYAACSGGGGGAGGLRWFTAQTPTVSTYVATVGAGGAGGSGTYGAAGSNSSFIGTGISITGSGGGGGERNHSGHSTQHGGSGGGASSDDTGQYGHTGTGNAGGYTPVEGYAGVGPITPVQNGHGGGGSGGSPVSTALTTTGGVGGVGEDNFLNQSSAAFTIAATKALLDSVAVGEVSGSSRHIAAGGGGGYYTSTNFGLGGVGYGGNGGDGTVVPEAGPVNTGSGGGGGGGSIASGSTQAGGNGGSGIVVVRYLA